jgi:hypothetical protein
MKHVSRRRVDSWRNGGGRETRRGPTGRELTVGVDLLVHLGPGHEQAVKFRLHPVFEADGGGA